MITGGTAFAQVLGIILLPIITRLYPPEDYGILSVYGAVLGIVCFLGSMNYEMGVPIAANDEKAINILTLSIIILLFSTTLITIIFTFFGDVILILFNGESLIVYKYFIPVGILFLGLYNIFTQWAYRKKNYRAITKTKFNQALIQNFITIGLGVLGKGPFGLLLGRVFGQSAGIPTLLSSFKRGDMYLLKKIKKQELLWAAKRFYQFPLYTTPRRFLGDMTISLPIIFITSLYGSQAVGLFGLANSVIQLPMNLIGSSVSSVFYAESASLRKINSNKVKELSNNLLKKLIIVGIIPLVILVFFGPLVFTLFFGSAWKEAGFYASILSFSVFFRLIFKPISNIFDVYEKQKLALFLNIFRLLSVLIVFGVSKYLTLSPYWAIGLYSFAMSAIYILQYILAQKILNDEITRDRENNKNI
jgi:O-antigen/teichoic acid export membrane protein